MVNDKKRSNILLLAVTVILLATTSCENEPGMVGLDTLPPSDLARSSIDNQKITGTNILPERIISDGSSRGALAILGYYNDPHFGLTKADFVTEINITEAIDGFSFNPESSLMEPHKFAVDSLVLYLSYTRDTWFGNKNDVHNVRVYELNERLSAIQRFFNDEPIAGRFYPELLGQVNVSAFAGLTDSIWNLPNYRHEMAIRLTDEMANRFFNLSAKDLAHRDSIKDAFNGFYITTGTPSNPLMIGSLLRIDLMNARSRLVLYYRRELRERRGDGSYVLLQVDPLSYTFPINEESRFFNRFYHDQSGLVPLNNPNASRAFIQGMAGSYFKFDLANVFASWTDSLSSNYSTRSNFGFGGIELIFHADTTTMKSTDVNFSPFTRQLIILKKDASGKLIAPVGIDRNGTSHPAFISNVANYDVSINGFQFRMNQAYFEKIARGEIEQVPFFLGIINPQFNFNRVILFNNHESLHPRIRIKYVKYK